MMTTVRFSNAARGGEAYQQRGRSDCVHSCALGAGIARVDPANRRVFNDPAVAPFLLWSAPGRKETRVADWMACRAAELVGHPRGRAAAVPADRRRLRRRVVGAGARGV